MKKKYEFTGEEKEFMCRKVRRIRSLVEISRDFLPIVKPGDLGGWIEKEDNLSHDGDAWVAEEAYAIDDCRVSGNALVRGEAMISNNAVVSGNSLVRDSAVVRDYAYVRGYAQIEN